MKVKLITGKTGKQVDEKRLRNESNAPVSIRMKNG